jgi:hypothetical protein
LFTVEPSGAREGLCDCCGQMSRRVWGLVFSDDSPCASYFVDWTVGHVIAHGVDWNLVLGEWGERTGPADRYLVRLTYRLIDGTPNYSVGDANRDGFTRLAGHVFSRADFLGTSLAPQVFAICDAILAQDARLHPLVEPSP